MSSLIKIKQLTVERFCESGQGVAVSEGKKYLVWNALPQEEVLAATYGKKKRYFISLAQEITKSSPDRIQPEESHFLCCSPWQILSWQAENRIKQTMALDLFKPVFGDDLKEFPLIHGETLFGYRNKMEYSFVQTDRGPSLAFFERGSRRKTAITPCRLADPAINRTAEKIVLQLTAMGLDPLKIKSLVLRSDNQGRVLAGLFVKEKIDPAPFTALAGESCEGFSLHYSDPRSPVAVSHEQLGQWGRLKLNSFIHGLDFSFGLLSFFQVNPELFEKVLTTLEAFTDKNRKLVDYYSGVGVIGLSLAGHFHSSVLVDNSAENIRFAEENILKNRAGTSSAFCCEAEKMTELIESDSVLMLDPPRCGLHPKVIKQILLQKPIRILYLSCNPLTQAKDLEPLKGVYKLKKLCGYNFFPRTPHLECLCVLDRI